MGATPSAIVIVGATSVMALLVTLEPPGATPNRLRLGSIAGFIAVVPVIALGAIWPSFYTIAALFAVPASLLFLVSLVRPELRLGLTARRYCLVAVWLSPALWASQVLWLLGLARAT